MTEAEAIAALKAAAIPGKAAVFARYHKVVRPYLGVPTPAIDQLAADIVATAGPADGFALAMRLWETNLFEARILAAKICCRPRLKNYADIWAAIALWKEDFDSWAIADAVAKAGARCLRADPARLDDVETWTRHPNMWVRRAALVFTLDWAKRGADPARMLGWAADYVDDRDWFIQKAIGWWLRERSRHDPEAVRTFLARHENGLAPVARREATKYLDR